MAHRSTRRTFLKYLATTATGAAAPLGWSLQARAAHPDPKFLIVLGCTGGAAINASAMAIRRSEIDKETSDITSYEDKEVVDLTDTQLRAVDTRFPSVSVVSRPYVSHQSMLMKPHRHDIMVATYTCSSINHLVAQRRSVTGGGALGGRTLQEAVAAEYGAGCPMANVNMGAAGFFEDGTDPTLAPHARSLPVVAPELFAVGTDGLRGIHPKLPGRSVLDMPSKHLLNRARALRDGTLDPQSGFARTFKLSQKLRELFQTRREVVPRMEEAELVDKLIMTSESPATPWSHFGMRQAPEAQQLREVFPNLMIDNLEAQAALTFLLIKNDLSRAVTISPNFAPSLNTNGLINPPLAFDGSHGDHYGVQGFMWDRVMSVADRLARLLKATEYPGGQGGSYWDRTMIYFATDFGRGKKRQPEQREDVSSVHDPNNGVMIWSPMVNGGRVLGGIDPQTARTYGFDPYSGDPIPQREMNEGEIFAGALQALGVPTPGLPDMRAMRKVA